MRWQNEKRRNYNLINCKRYYHCGIFNCRGGIMRDPKENRERFRRLLAENGEDYEALALENKKALAQLHARQLLAETMWFKIRQEPCKCN